MFVEISWCILHSNGCSYGATNVTQQLCSIFHIATLQHILHSSYATFFTQQQSEICRIAAVQQILHCYCVTNFAWQLKDQLNDVAWLITFETMLEG